MKIIRTDHGIDVDVPPVAAEVSLTREDVEWCKLVRQKAMAAAAYDAGPEPRRFILHEMARRLKGYRWTWSYATLADSELEPCPMKFDHADVDIVQNQGDIPRFGRVAPETFLKESIAYARHVHRAGKQIPGESIEFGFLVKQPRMFARTIHGMYPSWDPKQQAIHDEFKNDVKIDDRIYVIRPLPQQGRHHIWIGVGMSRLLGEPSFSPYDTRLMIQLLSECAPIVHKKPKWSLPIHVARAVKRAQYPVVSLYMAGCDTGRIVRGLVTHAKLEPSTARKYITNATPVVRNFDTAPIENIEQVIRDEAPATKLPELKD